MDSRITTRFVALGAAAALALGAGSAYARGGADDPVPHHSGSDDAAAHVRHEDRSSHKRHHRHHHVRHARHGADDPAGHR